MGKRCRKLLRIDFGVARVETVAGFRLLLAQRGMLASGSIFPEDGAKEPLSKALAASFQLCVHVERVVQCILLPQLRRSRTTCPARWKRSPPSAVNCRGFFSFLLDVVQLTQARPVRAHLSPLAS